jgi:hypothetical protein
VPITTICAFLKAPKIHHYTLSYETAREPCVNILCTCGTPLHLDTINAHLCRTIVAISYATIFATGELPFPPFLFHLFHSFIFLCRDMIGVV